MIMILSMANMNFKSNNIVVVVVGMVVDMVDQTRLVKTKWLKSIRERHCKK